MNWNQQNKQIQTIYNKIKMNLMLDNNLNLNKFIKLNMFKRINRLNI